MTFLFMGCHVIVRYSVNLKTFFVLKKKSINGEGCVQAVPGPGQELHPDPGEAWTRGGRQDPHLHTGQASQPTGQRMRRQADTDNIDPLRH